MLSFRNPILDCTTANREKMREAERLIKSFYDFKDACSDEPKEKSNTVKERQRRNNIILPENWTKKLQQIR